MPPVAQRGGMRGSVRDANADHRRNCNRDDRQQRQPRARVAQRRKRRLDGDAILTTRQQGNAYTVVVYDDPIDEKRTAYANDLGSSMELAA